MNQQKVVQSDVPLSKLAMITPLSVESKQINRNVEENKRLYLKNNVESYTT